MNTTFSSATTAHNKSLLEAALQYAANGYAVFPCKPRGKEPAPPAKHGFKDATTDEQTIRSWWSENPDYNIGLPTGKTNNIIVVDEDSLGAMGAQGWETEPTVETSRGAHFYYRHPGGHVNNRKLAHNIDLKADGAYVLAPPSIHPSGDTYIHLDESEPAECPRWLLEAIGHVPPPATSTGAELLTKHFAPVKWAVPDILAEGVTLFGGREKMGKSWLALGLCIAVATGGYALGKKSVEQGDALYLSPEDNERRLQERLRTLVSSEDTDLRRFHYATEWERSDAGGVEALGTWLQEHPDTRLVVIDTLKRIRPRTSGKRNMYEVDYEAIEPFVSLAYKHNTAIVIVHHLNQNPDPADPYDAFSGSSGLTAAVEGILLLTRERGQADAYLTVDGKDIADRGELALKWDADVCSWTVQGDADEYKLSKERREIVEVLESTGEPMRPQEIADALSKKSGSIRYLLSQMAKDGQVKSNGDGTYITPNTTNSTNTPNSANTPNSSKSVSGVSGSEESPNTSGSETSLIKPSVSGVSGVSDAPNEPSSHLSDEEVLKRTAYGEMDSDGVEDFGDFIGGVYEEAYPTHGDKGA